ncbi:winged helix-turn-helix transcriptional regulator [Candidatus Enterococcus ferrettii]|uniref:HTH hxlR-type domain-containing protein n=1 Tax=Candidatus Enterococcus ferrettii TaxID=2815324 RepID=A0ABV0EWT1_9ENTE|nr:helix-turn-helix domain-containing protein [Enterococcus sp. 665A]MBO1339463.1 helix-turn-helix transcriptional regulator [Enterococcus sp. 665A]
MSFSEEKVRVLNSSSYAISLINGKWKIRIICLLSDGEALRYSELKKSLPYISDRSLSKVLKEMCADNLLERKQFEYIPPVVQYKISKAGIKIIPILYQLGEWTNELDDKAWRRVGEDSVCDQQ